MPMKDVEFVMRRHVDVALHGAQIEKVPRGVEVHSAPAVERHVADLYGVHRLSRAQTELTKRLRRIEQARVRVRPGLRTLRIYRERVAFAAERRIAVDVDAAGEPLRLPGERIASNTHRSRPRDERGQ